MRPLAIALCLAGCQDDGGDPEAAPRTAAEFAPSPGMAIELVPPDHGESKPLHLRVRQGEWELREGYDWAQAEPVAIWTVETGGDLVVDGATVLPKSFQATTRFDNGAVTGMGAVEVWYGTFPDTVTVELDAGPLSGEVVLAPGIGPIRFALGMTPWELGGYTP